MDSQNNYLNQGDNIETAIRLFDGYLPKNTTLTIEANHCRTMYSYIYRLIYTSKNSGRTMCMVAKGNNLPTCHDDIFTFYLRQLYLTPNEVRMEFSRMYFLDRRAKQEQFLFSGKNIRVSDSVLSKDTLPFEGYSKSAAIQLDALKRSTYAAGNA